MKLAAVKINRPNQDASTMSGERSHVFALSASASASTFAAEAEAEAKN